MIEVTPQERDAIFRQDFIAFFLKAFEILYPGEKLILGWYLEAIARFLEDSRGKRARKIINAPPRSLKSFIVSVAWVAFVLSRDPTHKFMCVSYSGDLAAKLHASCRRLMESDWYCNLTSTRLEKSTENELVTTQGGYRYATSVGGTLTGLGADTIIVDDPISADEARSEVSRRNVIEWFTKALMSRLNNKKLGNDAALTRLKIACPVPAERRSARASQASVTALLVEGIEQATAREPPDASSANR